MHDLHIYEYLCQLYCLRVRGAHSFVAPFWSTLNSLLKTFNFLNFEEKWFQITFILKGRDNLIQPFLVVQ